MTAPLVDHGFMDARARMLDIAAFLDRMDRHGQANDWRVQELKRVLPLLLSDEPDRARRILESLSDPTTEPIPVATTQGATGAWPGRQS